VAFVHAVQYIHATRLFGQQNLKGGKGRGIQALGIAHVIWKILSVENLATNALPPSSARIVSSSVQLFF
jgi:hypothetical protein